MGKGLVSNYINLFKGRLISHLIGAIGSLLIIRILEPQYYGDLSLAMSIPLMVGAFGNLGMNTAVTKFTAQYSNDPAKAKQFISSGILFDILYGVTLSILGYILSPYIFTFIYNKPFLIGYGQFASLYSMVYWPFSSIFSAMLGFEMTKYNGKLWIMHYFFQTLFTVVLALYWLKVDGVILGYMLAYLLVVIYGIYTLYKEGLLKGISPSLRVIRQMLSFSAPLVLSSSLSTLAGIYASSIVNRILSVVSISNITAAGKIGFFFDTIFNPLSFAIQPLMSKLDKNNPENILKILTKIIKFNMIVKAPLTVVIAALSYPITELVIGAQYTSSPLFLKLIMIGYLIGSINGISIANSLVTFQGYTKPSSRSGIVNAVFNVILLTFLIVKFGPIGYYLAGFFSWIPGYIILYKFLRKIYNFKYPIKMTFRVLALTLVVLSPLFLISSLFGVALSIFLLIILFKLYKKTGILDKDEVDLLVNGIEETGLRPIAKIVSFILS
nr:oligosaccharide flippase family protein [Acidianus sp. RZ1]